MHGSRARCMGPGPAPEEVVALEPHREAPRLAAGGKVILALPCLRCVEHHECNIQGRVELTPPSAAIRARFSNSKTNSFTAALVVPAMRLEIPAPFLGRLDGGRQSCQAERCRKFRTHRMFSFHLARPALYSPRIPMDGRTSMKVENNRTALVCSHPTPCPAPRAPLATGPPRSRRGSAYGSVASSIQKLGHRLYS